MIGKQMYKPKYEITSEILQRVGEIEAAREVIENAPLVPAWERKFQGDAVARTVHHGTHLEGNELNLAEVEKVIEGDKEKGKVQGKKRDIQEVINYREVMSYLDELYEAAEVGGEFRITEEMFKEIHRLTVEGLLAKEEAGKYREVKVVIRNTSTGEITFRPPSPIEIPYLMNGFFSWLNGEEAKKVHAVLRAGIVHYELARVHPFTDGNGRTARALALLVLYIGGYKAKKFFSLEEYYDRNPGDYYDALKSVKKRDEDLSVWLEYFVKGIAIEFGRVKQRVQKLSLDLKLKGSLGGRQVALTERQIKLVEYLERFGSMKMSDGKEVLPMVSDDTVLRDLRDLIEKGLVRKKGKTKGTRYFLKKGK